MRTQFISSEPKRVSSLSFCSVLKFYYAILKLCDEVGTEPVELWAEVPLNEDDPVAWLERECVTLHAYYYGERLMEFKAPQIWQVRGHSVEVKMRRVKPGRVVARISRAEVACA